MKKKLVVVLLACACAALGWSCIGPFRSGGGEGRSAEEIALRFGPGSPFAEPAEPEDPEGLEPSAVTGSDGPVYRLSIGDTVVIVMRSPAEQQLELRVDENGQIKLPLLEPLKAIGNTMAEMEEIIRTEYLEKKIFKYITVNVFVPSRSYFVRGEVRQPGRFPLMGGMTLLQAMATAGGYTDFANTRKIEVIRGGRSLRIDAKDLERSPEKDIPIENGDIVIVPRGIF